MTDLKFYLYLLLIILLGFMLLSGVNAGDADNTVAIDKSNDNLCVPVNNSNDMGSFDDLYSDISNLRPGDTYNIDKDYYYDESSLVPTKYGIIVNINNVVINGNGHIIDGGNKSILFSVYANDVKFFNLTFINSCYNPKVFEYDYYEVQEDYSPINWQGDNGEITNCIFKGNYAKTNGGAISWNGDNGVISNTLFVNNSAGVAGGAIHIMGSDNKICNCMFLDSTSLISGDAIYVDRNHKNCTISSIFDNKNLIADGSISNIDMDYLNYIYESSFAGEKINLIPLLYSAIMSTEDYVRLNDDTIFYAEHLAKNFILTLIKDFGDGFIYERGYHFFNVENVSDVFKMMIDENYKNDFTLTKRVIVYTQSDYENARKTTSDCIFSLKGYEKVNEDCESISQKSVNDAMLQLEVVFNSALIIDSDKTWNPYVMGFDVVNIIGCGSTIQTSSGDRDENKWVTINGPCIFSASNLTIQGYNTAVENLAGSCIFNFVRFNDNHMDYWFERDWGAAILNGCSCVCNNCTFTNNKCGNGGAIFNQGELTLNNCTFKNNYAYHNGNDVLNADEGKVFVDNAQVIGSKGCVEYIESFPGFANMMMGILGMSISFFLGFVAGVATANPFLGFAIGAGMGAVMGAVFSGIIITNNYDINLNRLKTCVVLMAGCSLAGGLGGAIGGIMAQSAAAEISEESVRNVVLDVSDSGWSDAESVSSLSQEWDGFLKFWDEPDPLPRIIEIGEDASESSLIHADVII